MSKGSQWQSPLSKTPNLEKKMAKQYSLTLKKAKMKARPKPEKKYYRLAAKRIAFKQATLIASAITTITAVGYFLALSKYALLLWGGEFFIVLIVSYQISISRLYKDAADLLEDE